MKNRILRTLGIALTLAMVASLFAFSPVSAKSSTNDNFFSATFSPGTTSGAPPGVAVRRYNGPPTVLSDGTTSVTKDGQVLISETVSNYINSSGNFGPIGSFTGGTCVLTLKSTINYQSLKWEYNGTYFLDFGSHGTLSLVVHNSRQFKYFYLGKEVWDANARYVSTGGTGDFANFHCQGGYMFDYSSSPAGVMVGTCTGWITG